ncbi:MAG: hypothetical protein ABI832_17810 [bacterium]
MKLSNAKELQVFWNRILPFRSGAGMRAVLTVSLLLSGAPIWADGTLQGRRVTLNVLTYDSPDQVILDSQGRTVTVSDGVEFGMGPEYRTPGFDVVPVQVQIGQSRIEFSYGTERGTFWDAKFNGYVLRFKTDCALFTGWHVDAAGTTMAVTDSDIHAEVGALFINVAGRDYGPDATLAVDLDVADCPMS